MAYHSERKGKQLTNNHSTSEDSDSYLLKSCGPCSHSNEKGVVFKFVCTLVIRSSCPFLVIPISMNNCKTKIHYIFSCHTWKYLLLILYFIVLLNISNSPAKSLIQFFKFVLSVINLNGGNNTTANFHFF